MDHACLSADWREAEQSYKEALQMCPVCFNKERAILFSNRAAARMHLVTLASMLLANWTAEYMPNKVTEEFCYSMLCAHLSAGSEGAGHLRLHQR